MNEQRLPPIHPGEILLIEFMEPVGVDPDRLARSINVSSRRVTEIVQGKRGISRDTARRLALHFGVSEQFWINLQTRYDLEVEKDRLADRLELEVPVVLAHA